MNDMASTIRNSPASWPLPAISPPDSEVALPFAIEAGDIPTDCDAAPKHIFRTKLGKLRKPVKRIIVLKLDTPADFIIGLPALSAIRDAFPQADIRLICGIWNKSNATECGLVDEVRCFNRFVEAKSQDSKFGDPLSVFDRAADGQHDIAIDLGAEEDTRDLLGRVHATMRCGIGSRSRFPLLDVALPSDEGMPGDLATVDGGRTAGQRYMFFAPEQFHSTLPVKSPLHQFGSLAPGEIFRGPDVGLPFGRLLLEIGITIRGHLPGLHPAAVHYDLVKGDGQIIATKTFGRGTMHRLRRRPVVFEFENPLEGSKAVVRAYVTGRPRPGTVQFSGVTAHQLEPPSVALTHPSRTHQAEARRIGEMLLSLVALIRVRAMDLFEQIPAPPSLNDNLR